MPSLSRDERNERALQGEHGISHLGRSALNGTIISFAGQMARIVVQFGSVAVLARLLSPADFGLVAMAFTLTSFVSMFTDLGLSTATLQRENISQKLVSTLFFINLIVGVALMLATIAMAPVAAWVFGDPRVTLLTICLSLAIPISSLGAQHGALLGRAMRWVPIQLSYLIGQAGGLAIAILLLLFFDVGYWALVAQGFAAPLLTTVTCWIACRWRPSLICDWRAARTELHFGLHLTGFNIANWFNRQFDNALIGWRWGPTELGYYNRAYNLLIMPISFINGPIGAAVMPLLSRFQSKPVDWKRYYLIALAGSCGAGYLMATLLYLTSSEIIEILLGPQWTLAGTIFAVLAISMFPATPINTVGWIYMSLGRTRRMFHWGLFSSALIAISFLIGLPDRAMGVARAYTIIMCVLALPGMAYAIRGTSLSLREVVRLVIGFLFVALITIGTAQYITRDFAHDSPFLRLLVKGCIAGTIYLILAGLLILLDPAQAGLRSVCAHFLSSLRRLRSGRAGAEPPASLPMESEG